MNTLNVVVNKRPLTVNEQPGQVQNKT